MNNDKFQELRDKTFDYEDNQEHFVGSHFDAFFENMEEEVMMQIPNMLGKGVVVEPYYLNNEDIPKYIEFLQEGLERYVK